MGINKLMADKAPQEAAKAGGVLQDKIKNQGVLFASKGLIGTITGWIMGRFLKQITDQAIYYLGLGCSLIGTLHYMQWITINWSEIDEDLLHLRDRVKKANEDKGLVQKVKRFVMRTAPLLTGFGVGFKMAFFGSSD